MMMICTISISLCHGESTRDQCGNHTGYNAIRNSQHIYRSKTVGF